MAPMQLHPNRRRVIAIRSVDGVYKGQRRIPLHCYPFKNPRRQTAVTPEQVAAALKQHAEEELEARKQHNAECTGDGIDTASIQPLQTPSLRLHPGGRRSIAIRQVENVYAHEHPIPAHCYPLRKPRLRTMVTPEQMEVASARYHAERAANDIARASTQAPHASTLQIQRQAVQLHPNGRRLVAIREVDKVYAHQCSLPISCYPFRSPRPQTMVTPEQVAEAIAQYDVEISNQHDAERFSDILYASTSQVPQRLHRNGQRLIAIRDVDMVYDFDRWDHIDMRFYPIKWPRPHTLITPEQLVQAAKAANSWKRSLQVVDDIDTAFGLVPEGGLWENLYDD